MEVIPTERIRNVALVGHGGAGKTTLAEAMLLEAGLVSRLGRVEDGTTVCDSEPEEQRRGQSLSLALAPIVWKGHRINLLDAPGYADFEGEALTALRVADLAVFVVSAVAGPEVQTIRLWKAASEMGLPRMVFVNKLDRERASFPRTLDQLRDRLGAGVAPLELPIGEEAGFTGLADLLTDTAFIYDGTSGGHITAAIPDDMEALEHQVHDNLVEGIVVADDALLERYLEGEVPTVDELEHTLAHGIDQASVFPVVCGSATGRVGIDRLIDLICEIGPSPSSAHRWRSRPATPSSTSPLTPRANRSCSCSRRWPIPSSGRSRSSGCSPARSAPTTTSSTPVPAPTSACTACSGWRVGSTNRSTCSSPATSVAWPS